MTAHETNETLPTTIAARSAVDLMLCVIVALLLGIAVVTYQSWTVWFSLNLP